MINFDLDREEFAGLVKDIVAGNVVVDNDVADNETGTPAPALVQLMAKVRAGCSPLELYAVLQQARYSYLLESVEKEKRHARFSFVGADPDVVVSIKDRVLTLDFPADSPKEPGSCPGSSPNGSGLADYIRSKIAPVCTVEAAGDGVLRARINEGIDVLDAFRAVFPTANGTVLLNQKRFDRQTFLGGAIGYNGYDIVYDSWLDIEKELESGVPDMQFALTTRTFVFDHLTDDTYIVVTPFVTPGCDPVSVYEDAVLDAELMCGYLKRAGRTAEADAPDGTSDDKSGDTSSDDTEDMTLHRSSEPSEPVCNMEREEFENAVLAAKQHIIDGDIFQVVLSRRYSIKIRQTPLELYRTLRQINPSPYMYLFKFGDLGIVGASPETLMTVHQRKVITNPIAGTCPRTGNDKEDAKSARRMLGDEKECAEHVMLVDLGRNDVRMVSKGGTIKVDDFMSVVKYSHVQHIESTVSGVLRDECDQFDATRAIFPAGTLSGAPKIRAMEIIDSLETAARGIYGGGVGYYSWNGDADFAIVIRTVILKGDTAYIQAGAGIVADSDPTYEYNETERKMAAMLKAITSSETRNESK
ncbi:MAG: anthranilate synthase component I [Methanosarcinaceae archaeon]|nr:anthranilate synthase component I [Methanosarcinaceae archaeon]